MTLAYWINQVTPTINMIDCLKAVWEYITCSLLFFSSLLPSSSSLLSWPVVWPSFSPILASYPTFWLVQCNLQYIMKDFVYYFERHGLIKGKQILPSASTVKCCHFISKMAEKQVILQVPELGKGALLFVYSD